MPKLTSFLKTLYFNHQWHQKSEKKLQMWIMAVIFVYERRIFPQVAVELLSSGA
jgi:hypothetical protein